LIYNWLANHISIEYILKPKQQTFAELFNWLELKII